MKISRLSFVVIAHNEQFALDKCLTSIAGLESDNCEIICVDADSTDKTLEVALSFKETISCLKIIQIKGHQNASIARNAGLMHATGEIVFFVDGDVELNDEFIRAGLDKIRSGDADAVFGMLDDHEYDDNYTKIARVRYNRTSIHQEEKRYHCGGIFMTRKSIIDEIGLFDARLVKCEDFDFTLRLTRKYTLKALPVSMGIHHTVPYSNKSRLKNELRKGLPVYYGYLLRNNFQNFRGCFAFVRRAGFLKGLLVLCVFIASAISHMLAYLGVLLVAVDIIIGLMKRQDILYRMVEHYLVPLMMIYGLLTGIKDMQQGDNSIKLVWESPQI